MHEQSYTDNQQDHYRIADDAYMTVVEDVAVFLDLKSDTYIALDPLETSALLSVLSVGQEGMHSSAVSALKRKRHGAPSNAIDPQEVVQKLQSAGLLTITPKTGNKAVLQTVHIPQDDLSGHRLGKRPAIKAKHVAMFFWSCLKAHLKLRLTSTKTAVRSVENRKKRYAASSKNDPETVRTYVEIFKRLRPLFFTAHNHCLFDSLALIEFMALAGIYPIWVFGVHIGPFGAHCWVQDEHFVYNEHLDQAHFFTPIMAI